MVDPYNPLDKVNLGRSVAEALLVQKLSPLSQTTHLIGAGIYAIYYKGRFRAYRPLVERNRTQTVPQPIYVGKAVPKGARKGGLSFDASKGRALRDRLSQHASSINQAHNLDLADFEFRSLVVDDVWIPLGENMLIEQFQPIWNLVIDGFGNKDPGKRRATQFRSQWDVLHRGRAFAEKLADGGMTAESLTTKLANYFAGRKVPLVAREDATDLGTIEEPED